MNQIGIKQLKDILTTQQLHYPKTMKKLILCLLTGLSLPAFADVETAARLAEKHAEKSYCSAESEKVLPLNNDGFLVLTRVDGARYGEHCSFGSGSDFFMLKMIKPKNGKLRVMHDNLFNLWTDGENMTSNKFTYRILGMGNPDAPNNRHIKHISLINPQTLRLITLEHDENDGNNFPSQRWQFDIRLSDMAILQKRLLGYVKY